MSDLKSLLVVAALDERDEATLDVACWLAGAFQLRSVTLAHIAPAWERPPYWPADSSEVPLGVDEREIETQLDRLAAKIRPCLSRDTAIEPVMRRGALVTQLIGLARECSADLVCLGTTGTTQYDQLTQSVAGLVRKLPCSVLTVPQGTKPPLERLLVPIDFSDLSRETVSLALQLADSRPNAVVTVQHVYQVPVGFHKTGQSREHFATSMLKLARDHWQAWSEELGRDLKKVQVRLDLSDEVPAAILAAADEIDAQLIVLGGHGRTLPSGVLLGHTADVVVRHSTRSVLCLKKKGQVVHLAQALLQLLSGKD